MILILGQGQSKSNRLVMSNRSTKYTHTQRFNQ